MMATEHTLLKCLSQHGYGASVAQAGSAEVAVLWRLSMSLQYLPLPFAHPLAHLPRNRSSQVPETASPLKSSLPPFYLHLAALHLRLPFRPPAPEPHSQVPEPASPSDSPPAAAHFARPPERGHATAGPLTTFNESSCYTSRSPNGGIGGGGGAGLCKVVHLHLASPPSLTLSPTRAGTSLTSARTRIPIRFTSRRRPLRPAAKAGTCHCGTCYYTQ
jgi:hypothetical protein